MDDQTTFLILMGLCCLVGFVLSLSGVEPRVIKRKICEDEMGHYLAKHKGPRPKGDER